MIFQVSAEYVFMTMGSDYVLIHALQNRHVIGNTVFS